MSARSRLRAALRAHTAVVSPWLPDGSYGEPYDLPCSAQLAASAVQDVDGIRASGFLLTEPGDPIAIGSKITVRGYAAVITLVENWDDGDIVGLSHRKVEWQTHPMLSTGVVERFDGEGELDPETNTYPEIWTAVWAGQCRVQTLWVDRNENSGEQRIDYDRLRVAVPWPAPEFLPSMRLRVVESIDPHLVGMVAILESSDRDAVGAERRYIARVDRG